MVSQFSNDAIHEPRSITTGPDGNLWFTSSGIPAAIGRLTPAGVFTIFRDIAISQPDNIMSGPDGNLWFTTGGSIGRMTPAGALTTFTTSGMWATNGLTVGPDGNMWFTSLSAGQGGPVGRITLAGTITLFNAEDVRYPNGVVTGPDDQLWVTDHRGALMQVSTSGEFGELVWPLTPDPDMYLDQIIVGPDNNLRFPMLAQIAKGPSAIGRMTTSGDVTKFSVPGSGNGIKKPSAITAGPDGNMWFTNSWNSLIGRASIGRITPDGHVSSFTDPAIGGPTAIVAGPDGNIWFIDSQTSIGRITTAGAITIFRDAGITSAWGITAGADGNLWFTNGGWPGSIGRITTSGVVTTFSGSNINYPKTIATGDDGNVWFGNLGSDIAKITPGGVVTRYTDERVNRPQAMTAGPDGNIWFANLSSPGTIGRITPFGSITTFPSGWAANALTAGPDGAMWFTGGGSGLGRMTLDGELSSFTAPTAARSVSVGPDGNLWTTSNLDQVGKFQLTGAPGPPDEVRPVASNGAATVRWQPPVLDGRSPITGYTATAWPGGQSCTWTQGPLSCVVHGLDNGTTYTFNVVATSAHGFGSQSGPSTAAIPHPGSRFTPITPNRVLDSRPESKVGPYDTPWTPHTDRAVAVAGVNGIPADAAAVVMNITVNRTTSSSFLSVWPSGGTQPWASSLNWSPGWTVSNAVTSAVGPDGKVSLYNNEGATDVIVDVVGFYRDTGSGYTPRTSTRVLDSRPATKVGAFDSPWTTGQTRNVRVAGVNGVPANATAVTLNITATGTSATSYLTVWPTGQAKPVVSSLNWSPGWTIPNAVTAKVGTDGNISLYNNAGVADVVIDIVGYFGPDGNNFYATTPTRVIDSRPPDHIGAYNTPWGAGSTRDVHIGEIGDAAAVMLNATATGTSATSFLTVWPSGEPKPLASSLNWSPGWTIPNAVTANLGPGDDVSVYNNAGGTDVIFDVVGWFGP